MGETVTYTADRSRVRLALEGMTCASCAKRIERGLNGLDGVEASVNYATEQATVDYDPARAAVDDLLRAVEAAGYRASLEARADADETRVRALETRLVVAAALTVPLTALALLPPLQFEGWEWLALALATPVVLWAGIGFHRAALANAKDLRGAALSVPRQAREPIAVVGRTAERHLRGPRPLEEEADVELVGDAEVLGSLGGSRRHRALRVPAASDGRSRPGGRNAATG